MSAISLADWGRYRDAGVTTYAVGPVPVPAAVYADRAEAEAAADELDGTCIEWAGRTGRQVSTVEAQADAEAYADEPGPLPEPEPEAEL
jgi:hypothetical protein